MCVFAARAINLKSIYPGHDPVSSYLKKHLFFRIAKIDPESNIESIKEWARTRRCCDKLLLRKVIRWEAQFNLKAAKNTALQSRFPSLLTEIVKVEAQIDPINAWATVQQMLEKRSNLVAIAQSLAIIAKAHDQDYGSAIYIAQLITDADEKFEAYAKIAKYNPLIDLSFLKNLAALLRDDWSRMLSFLQIIKIEARRDLAAAKKTLEQVDHSKALVEIAKVEVLTDPAAVVRTAMQLPLDNKVLLKMVKILAPYDLNGTRAVIQRMEEGYNKDRALKHLVKHDPENPFETAKTIRDGYYRVKAYIEIAKRDPKLDIQFVKTEAERLEFRSFEALVKIVKVEAMMDLNAGLATAKKIQDDRCRLNAFIAIGKVALRNLKTACCGPIQRARFAKF